MAQEGTALLVVALPDTWATREYPVLREVVRLTDETPRRPRANHRARAVLDLSPDDVQRAGIGLAAAGLVETAGDMDMRVSEFWKSSAEARRQVGLWPTPESALDRMIAALEAISDNTDTPVDDRTRARKFAAWLGSTTTTVGTTVAAAAITGQLPGAGA